MKTALKSILAFLFVPAACAMAAETGAGAIGSATAQPMVPAEVTITGRAIAVSAARVSPRVSGILAEFGKDDAGKSLDAGMRVKKGQTLFRLDETTMKHALAGAEASLTLAKANLANLKAAPREERVAQLKAAIAELDARLTDKERELERYKRLVEVEKTLPLRRLEEAQTDAAATRWIRDAAAARLREANNGPTPTETAMAEAQVAQAQAAVNAAQDDLRDATVKAPFNGVITSRAKGVGDYINGSMGNAVIELIGDDEIEIELRLPEAYMPAIEPGVTPTVIRSPLLKSELKLPIARVVTSIETTSGLFTIRVPVPAEKKDQLVPGAFVSASVSLGGDRRGVLIPERAVVRDGGKQYVFVADKGKLRRQEVQIGDRLTENVVINQGLSAGQKVFFGSSETVKEGTVVE